MSNATVELYKDRTKEDLIRELEETKQSIIRLGEDVVFARRDGKGFIRSVKQNVTLNADAQDIQYIAKTPDGVERYMVTVGGVAKLNRVPGLTAVYPKEIIIDGVAGPNPYPITKDNILKAVHVRVIVLGPNPLGNMCAVDYSLYFNLHTYLMQDLQSAIKKYPACGMLGIKEERPKMFFYNEIDWKTTKEGKKRPVPGKEVQADVSNKTLKFLEIGDGIGLWIDLGHPEIKAAFNSHVQRQKFGDRHAQSICTRNAMLLHPAIAAKNIRVKNKQAVIQVFGWKHELDPRGIAVLVDKVERGAVEELEAEGMVIDVTTASGEAGYEEVGLDVEGDEYGQATESESKASEEEIEGEGVLEPEPQKKNETQTEPEPKKEVRSVSNPAQESNFALIKKIEAYRGILGDAKFRGLIKKARIADLNKTHKTDLENLEKFFLKPAADKQ